MAKQFVIREPIGSSCSGEPTVRAVVIRGKSMDAAAIAKALPRGRKSGASWLACCPAHKDSTPSLSLRDAGPGRVLVHCHAGCGQATVIEALRDRGLWPQIENHFRQRRIVAEYGYCDEQGRLLYQVVRTDPKGFFQRYPDERGGWINRKHSRQVLYRLPEVLSASIVLLVEGEKDVETLRSYGFVATTIAGGAKSAWLSGFTQGLAGRTVILVPDNDSAGWELMRRAGTVLLGNVSRLICFDDHHRTGAKDITDWFSAGRSELELANRLEGICHSK